MRFSVITTFPDLVRPLFEHGIVRRAAEAGLIESALLDPRDFTEDRHRTTDDTPYGGGPGMVMLAEPLARAVARARDAGGAGTVVLLSPAGRELTHGLALELAAGEAQAWNESGGAGVPGRLDASRAATPAPPASPAAAAPHLILICGRYEGVDQRCIDELVDLEVSIGDYVLSGGELAAMVLIDALTRLLPGALGNAGSAGAESFAAGLLDWPHYTRPEIWRGRAVPDVLLSGNHARIISFREEEALKLTYRRRPDLLTAAQLELAERLVAAGDGKGRGPQRA